MNQEEMNVWFVRECNQDEIDRNCAKSGRIRKNCSSGRAEKSDEYSDQGLVGNHDRGR